MKKEYVVSYDVLKILATFLVCFYHLNLLYLGSVDDLGYHLNVNRVVVNACVICVPLFFMVNGALVLNKTYPIKKIAIRAIKIFFLYVFWIVLMNTLYAVVDGTMHEYSIKDILFHLSQYQDQFWFLKTMIYLTILTPVIKFFMDHQNKIVKYMFYIGLFLLFLFPFAYNYLSPIGVFMSNDRLASLPRTGVFTLYSILFFVAGKYLADRYRNGMTKSYDTILFTSFIIIGLGLVTVDGVLLSNYTKTVYDSVNGCFPTIGALMMSVGVFGLLLRVNTQDNKTKEWIKTISKNTMAVYIFHALVIKVIRIFISYPISLPIAILLALAIMGIILVISNVLRKSKIYCTLISI